MTGRASRGIIAFALVESLLGLVRLLYNRVFRRRLPRKIGTRAGVATPFGLLDVTTSLPEYEVEHVSALRSTVRSGDRVVIVGGGWGVTATLAAHQCGPDGRVDVYEAVPSVAEEVEQTVERNGVADRVTVHVERVDGETDLPECDVLELDCEGAEVDVLRHLDIQPRVLVVEHHV